jgi:hypothetical protein
VDKGEMILLCWFEFKIQNSKFKKMSSIETIDFIDVSRE